MATFSAVQRLHVLQAIEEHDLRGADDFLGVYGFVPSIGYALVHSGRTYDARAILGVAHRYATGRVAPSEEFRSGLSGAAALLRRRGFEVDGPAAGSPPERPASPAARRAPAARRSPTRAAAVPERVEAVCPTCFVVLPATGVCDQCG